MSLPYPRRSLSGRLFWFTLSVLTKGVGHVWFKPAQYVPRIERVRVPIPGLPAGLDGLTIAHLSDFHCGRHVYASTVRRAARMTMALQPDLIALTGDFVHHDVSYARSCA